MGEIKQRYSFAMRPLLIGVILSATAAMATQPPASQDERAKFRPAVRAIKVGAVSTSRSGLPAIPLTAFVQAWQANKVELAVESQLDIGSVEKAAEIIRDMYKAKGRSVRVEHEITQIGPGSSVEVAFRVM